MFQPGSKSQFSFQLFSLLSQLIQLSQNRDNTSYKTHMVQQMQQDFDQSKNSKYDTVLFSFLKQYALTPKHQPNQPKDQTISQLCQNFKSFLTSFSQSKVRISNQDQIVQNINQCKFIIADKRRLYSLKEQIAQKQQKQKQAYNTSISTTQYKSQSSNTQSITYKAFVIYGKAINVQKQKKISSQNQVSQQGASNISPQDLRVKQQTIANLQFCMTHLYNEQKLAFIKSQPHQIQDLLLTHHFDDYSLLPIIVTHQVYRLFVPIQGAILLLVPDQIIEPQKPQIPSIIKNTVLHVYIDNYKALAKIISKQSFFKNTNFRGIYFVEEGEVQTKGGRVVARGWVINGKCKSTTHVWKFNKIVPFFKYLLDNQNVYKQFSNDLKLNGQWPIKVSDVLNMDQKTLEQLMGEQATSFKLNSNNQRQKRIKFPPISSRLDKSFDISKLNEIYKMKHFDEKINHLHEFKQQMLKRKIQLGSKRHSFHQETQPSQQGSENQINKKIQILSLKMNLPHKGLKTDVSRSMILRQGQSSANILVTKIVKKLQNINTGSQRNSLQKLSQGQSKKKLLQVSRSKTKILGLKRYEQILKNEKYHLFRGKNLYN